MSRQSEYDKIRKSGKKTPLDFLLAVMWNKNASAAMRVDAAGKALPYVHKKMPLELEHSGEIETILPYIPSRGELASRYDDNFNVIDDEEDDL